MAEKPKVAVQFPAGCFERRAPIRVYQGAEPDVGCYLAETQAQDDGSASTVVAVPTGTGVCAVGRPAKGGDKVIFRAIAGGKP